MDGCTVENQPIPPIDAKAHLPDPNVKHFTLCGVPVEFRILASAAQGDVNDRAHIVIRLMNDDGVSLPNVCRGCALRWLHSMLPALSGQTLN